MQQNNHKPDNNNTLTARFYNEVRTGLFKNNSRRGRKLPPFQKTIIAKNGSFEQEIEIRSATTLYRSHLFLFLTLCKIASERGVVRISENDPLIEAMRGVGEFSRGARKITTRISLRDIAKKLGRSTGGKSLDLIMSYLRDLSSTTIFVRWDNEKGKKEEYSSALIGFYRVDDELSISFHTFLSLIISGEWEYYNSVTWSDFESLNNDNDKFLLSVLSSRVRPGNTQKIKASTLWNDIFGGEEANEKTLYDRRIEMDNGFQSLRKLGWKIELNGSTFEIFRPEVNAFQCAV
jgi:hypothetical protein